jgi:hypothetical protein
MADTVSENRYGTDLRRIDDFVKLLVGLVLGLFLRDVPEIRDGLRIVMTPDGAVLAAVLSAVFPYVFIVLVIRNVHASLRFDSWCYARDFRYETRVRGRALTFVAGLLALFASTYAVEQFLANNFAPHSATPQLLRAGAIGNVPTLAVFLSSPFVIYLIWDFVLWLNTDWPELRKDKVMQRFISRWLFVDAVGLGWLLAGILFYNFLARNSADGGLALTLIFFSVLAVGTVVVDYWRNLGFYFGQIKSTKAER